VKQWPVAHVTIEMAAQSEQLRAPAKAGSLGGTCQYFTALGAAL